MCFICVQTLYSILLCHHFAVNNILHKLFIQDENIPGMLWVQVARVDLLGELKGCRSRFPSSQVRMEIN